MKKGLLHDELYESKDNYRTKSSEIVKLRNDTSFSTCSSILRNFLEKTPHKLSKSVMLNNSHFAPFEAVIEEQPEDNEEKEKPKRKLSIFSDLKEDSFIKRNHQKPSLLTH